MLNKEGNWSRNNAALVLKGGQVVLQQESDKVQNRPASSKDKLQNRVHIAHKQGHGGRSRWISSASQQT
jgi:hypothetical protein